MRVARLLAALLLTTACTAAPETTTGSPPVSAGADAPSVVGMANPASVACGDLFGGELSMLQTPEGQVGMCALPDGRVCEEWVLFRDHRCAVNAGGPSIGEPVTPARIEGRRHSKSGGHGG